MYFLYENICFQVFSGISSLLHFHPWSYYISQVSYFYKVICVITIFPIEVIFTILITQRLITSQSQQLIKNSKNLNLYCHELYKCADSPHFNKQYRIIKNKLSHNIDFIFASNKLCIYEFVYTYCQTLHNMFFVVIIIVIVMYTTILFLVPYFHTYLCDQVPFLVQMLYLPDTLVILSAMLTSLNTFLDTKSNILLSDPNIDATTFKEIFRLACFLPKHNLHTKAVNQAQSNINLIYTVQILSFCYILIPNKLDLVQASNNVHCNSVCQNLKITISLCVVEFFSLYQNKIYYAC